jgi:hypothetical protein
VTLKSLVTGAAAAVIVGGAAAGVTSIAYPAQSDFAAPATIPVTPVVWDIPMPQAPAPELEGPLLQTLNVLAGPGTFGPNGPKAVYIQGGTGRLEAIGADNAYNRAVREGKFPLTFTITNINQEGPLVWADVTATAANGKSGTQNIQFVAGPSPTGWQISRSSALALLSAVG